MKATLNMNDQRRVNEQSYSILKQTEHELYTDLANALPSGVYRIRVSNDESLHEDNWLNYVPAHYIVEFVNDRFCEILNVKKSDFLENPGIINRLIHTDDKTGFAKANVESNLHTTPFGWEGRLNVEGQIKWVHFRSIPRVMGDNTTIWTGTLDDITQRKEHEQQLELKNTELLKLNADKDRFVSILAHDLKSPFNAILGLLDLLLTDIRDCDIEEIEAQLVVVKDSAHSAFNLLEDILLWARSHLGKIPFEPTEIDAKTCFDEVVGVLKTAADNKDISIDTEVPDQLSVFADFGMLKTVLRNLLSNAIKFSAPGSVVTMAARRNPSSIQFSVIDNGVGISNDTLSKLFNITKVYSTPGTAGETGTGLGLLLCKEFVDKHKGTIWAESELGKGSAFYVELPLQTGV